MKPQSTGGQKQPAPLVYHSDFSEQDYSVTFLITSYLNGNLALMLQTEQDGVTEDYATITVNFSDELLSPNQAYLDTNNMPEVEKFIEDNRLGKPTGRTKVSGFCTYPLYEFDLFRLMAHGVLAKP